MSMAWPKVRLGDVLCRSDETIVLEPDRDYLEVTVKLWGKGVVQRGAVTGPEISGQRRFVVRHDQFILSRIDARNGAIGIVPTELDGAVVSNDFPVFRVGRDRLLPEYLGWLCRTNGFVEECKKASEGTTNRVRLQESRFLGREVSLPPLPEQQAIVVRINELSAQLESIRAVRQEQDIEIRQMLLGAFRRLVNDSPRVPMRDVAPLIRRPVKLDPESLYGELGIRSFGRGTFHKPALSGIEIGSKRVFHIEPGDLLFSNVFAWEGAIAVAKPEDAGRIGSHRFMTCVPNHNIATSQFLCFYFLTQEGLELIRAASPGGALRNRTLGLTALDNIQVPIPPIEDQRWFDMLQAEVMTLRHEQAECSNAIASLLPAILDRAFKGELL